MTPKQLLFAAGKGAIIKGTVAAVAVAGMGTTAVVAGPAIASAVTGAPAAAATPHRPAASISLPAIPSVDPSTAAPSTTPAPTTSAAPTSTVAPAPAPAPAPVVTRTTAATRHTVAPAPAPAPAPRPAPAPAPAPAPKPVVQVTDEITIVSSTCSGPVGDWHVTFTFRFSDGTPRAEDAPHATAPAISEWDVSPSYGGHTEFFVANPNDGPLYRFPC